MLSMTSSAWCQCRSALLCRLYHAISPEPKTQYQLGIDVLKAHHHAEEHTSRSRMSYEEIQEILIVYTSFCVSPNLPQASIVSEVDRSRSHFTRGSHPNLQSRDSIFTPQFLPLCSQLLNPSNNNNIPPHHTHNHV